MLTYLNPLSYLHWSVIPIVEVIMHKINKCFILFLFMLLGWWTDVAHPTLITNQVAMPTFLEGKSHAHKGHDLCWSPKVTESTVDLSYIICFLCILMWWMRRVVKEILRNKNGWWNDRMHVYMMRERTLEQHTYS